MSLKYGVLVTLAVSAIITDDTAKICSRNTNENAFKIHKIVDFRDKMYIIKFVDDIMNITSLAFYNSLKYIEVNIVTFIIFIY